MATTADDWSIYWRVPVAYGYDPKDDDYDKILARNGYPIVAGHDSVGDEYYTIKVDSAGKLLLIQGLTTESIIEMIERKWAFVASDTLITSDDTEESHSGDFIKIKEFTFNPTNGVSINTAGFRFRWKQKQNMSATHQTLIKKSGVNWSETFNTAYGTTWQQFSVDLTGASLGDTFELWAKGLEVRGYVKDYRCYGDVEAITYGEPVWSG